MTTTQQLVEKYIPLANKLAYQKKKVVPSFIDVDDLRSAAYLGLVEAASRFDTNLGVAFSTFAYPRISGAICDFLREQGFGKSGAPMTSLDVCCDSDDGVTLKDMIEAKREDKTEENFEHVTISLDSQAKAVLRHYFIDEYSMKEVGEKFGVSESRISQLIKQYKDRIRGSWSETELRLELAA